MVACRSSSKNTLKMNLKLILNKTSLQAHMELELDVLGVPGKLVKYVVHLFLVSRNFRGSLVFAKIFLDNAWMATLNFMMIMEIYKFIHILDVK
jgi:hypothetical protein